MVSTISLCSALHQSQQIESLAYDHMFQSGQLEAFLAESGFTEHIDDLSREVLQSASKRALMRVFAY